MLRFTSCTLGRSVPCVLSARLSHCLNSRFQSACGLLLFSFRFVFARNTISSSMQFGSARIFQQCHYPRWRVQYYRGACLSFLLVPRRRRRAGEVYIRRGGAYVFSLRLCSHAFVCSDDAHASQFARAFTRSFVMFHSFILCAFVQSLRDPPRRSKAKAARLTRRSPWPLRALHPAGWYL